VETAVGQQSIGRILGLVPTANPQVSRQPSAASRAARQPENICRRACGLPDKSPTTVGCLKTVSPSRRQLSGGWRAAGALADSF